AEDGIRDRNVTGVQTCALPIFLRRIPYKIPVEDPSLEHFTQIFELNCRTRNLRFHQVMVAYLQRRHYAPNNRPMRACHPRDLIRSEERRVGKECRSERSQEP